MRSMIALDDAGLARFAIAATAIRPEDRHKWLREVARHFEAPKRGRRRALSAIRQRRYRRRVAVGRATFRIEVNVVDLELLLVTAGLLRPGDVDRSLVETALTKLIERLISNA